MKRCNINENHQNFQFGWQISSDFREASLNEVCRENLTKIFSNLIVHVTPNTNSWLVELLLFCEKKIHSKRKSKILKGFKCLTARKFQFQINQTVKYFKWKGEIGSSRNISSWKIPYLSLKNLFETKTLKSSKIWITYLYIWRISRWLLL